MIKVDSIISMINLTYLIIGNTRQLMKERFRGYAALWRNLGGRGFILYKIQVLRRRLFGISSPFTLLSKHSQFRLLCRPDSSDFAVFWQIFVKREYRCLDNIKRARFIVDCGANVGYSAAYFLTRFPDTKLIAVEPDPANCAMLEANLAGFAGRYRVIPSAIWSRETGLIWDETERSDGQEWARVVRPIKAGETPFVIATTIGSLLSQVDAERISILKIQEGGRNARAVAVCQNAAT
jgi:FkbM family methyltransferase